MSARDRRSAKGAAPSSDRWFYRYTSLSNRVRLQGELVQRACLACATPCSLTYPYCRECAPRLLGVEVRPSPTHGMGVFATRELSPGPLVPYCGEVLTPRQAQARYGFNATAPYAVTRPDGQVSDAALWRSLASCVNTAPNTAAINCALTQGLEGWESGGRRLVSLAGGDAWLTVTRRVPPGSELLASYGDGGYRHDDHTTSLTRL